MHKVFARFDNGDWEYVGLAFEGTAEYNGLVQQYESAGYEVRSVSIESEDMLH